MSAGASVANPAATRRQIIIAAVIAAAVGALVTTWGGYLARRAWQSRSWPVVQGVVVESTVVKERTQTAEGSTRLNTPRVVYEYQVDGATHQGERIAFGVTSTESYTRAQGIVNRYRVGQAVDVHVNPVNPGDAVLETGMPGMALALLGLGPVTLLGGLGGWVTMVVRGSRASPGA